MTKRIGLWAAASFALVGTLASTGLAQPAAPPAKGAAEPAKPVAEAAKPAGEGAAKPASESEDEGPFAPKGRTGKLKEEAAAETTKEEGGEAKDEEKTAAKAGLDVVIGFGKLGEAAASTKVTAYSFMLGGSYKFTPEFTFGLRFPMFTNVGFEPCPTSSDAKCNGGAIGNVELAPEYAVKLTKTIELPLELAIVLPTAGGDAFGGAEDRAAVNRFAVNEAAAAARGWEDNALFAPHRFGAVPKVGIEYERGAIQVAGYTKYELTFKAGGKSPEEGATEKLNSTGMVWVTGGSFFYSFLHDKVAVGTRAWFTQLVKEEIEVEVPAGSTAPSKSQFVLEPGVHAKIGAFRGGLGYIKPIGGRLGGDVAISGIRVSLGGAF